MRPSAAGRLAFASRNASRRRNDPNRAFGQAALDRLGFGADDEGVSGLTGKGVAYHGLAAGPRETGRYGGEREAGVS